MSSLESARRKFSRTLDKIRRKLLRKSDNRSDLLQPSPPNGRRGSDRHAAPHQSVEVSPALAGPTSRQFDASVVARSPQLPSSGAVSSTSSTPPFPTSKSASRMRNIGSNGTADIYTPKGPTMNGDGPGSQSTDDLNTVQKGLGNHYASSALYDAPRVETGCTNGTRVRFLDSAMSLATARGGANVVWITGMAGTGKTSIALTLCRRLRDDATIILGGTFFCSNVASLAERADARCIIPTLASVLASEVPSYAEALAAELKSDPDLAYKAIRVQVEHLLAKPLSLLASLDRQIVFVIDAVDECSDYQQLVELINVLANFKSSAPVKFVITSRPELSIRKSALSDPSCRSLLRLDNLDPAQATADIRLFIAETFESSPSPPKYTNGDLDALSMLADGLFAFAATAVAYILEPTDIRGRSERLHNLRNQKPTPQLTALDEMYSLVLSRALNPAAFEPDELNETRNIVGAIVSSLAPLTVKGLAELVEISPERLREALGELHAVIFVPDGDGVRGVRPLHPTLVDFLVSRAPSHMRMSTKQ